MQEQIENLRNGKTANPAKEEGLTQNSDSDIYCLSLLFSWLASSSSETVTNFP